MLLSAVAIFAGAFLLFEVQPIIGKMLLPWFGGGAAIWSACLMYFQVSLLLGYLYAHCLAQYLRAKHQVLVHSALLLASLALLPALHSTAWAPASEADPTATIVALLARMIGLPYLLLSATGPLLQSWCTRSQPNFRPYRLYALSNLGSMLALLSYPFAVEPALSTRVQTTSWSVGYVFFVATCIACGVRLLVQSQETTDVSEALGESKYDWRLLTLWIALSACPAGLLVAITAQLTHNVAPIPLLWTLPLALYLISFILCFEFEHFYKRRIFHALLVPALAAMAFLLTYKTGNVSMNVALPVFTLGLFACAAFCHGELAYLRPHPRHLTAFYLAIAIGGAIGGLFVSVIAPRLYSDYHELPILLVFCATLATVVVWRSFRLQRPIRTWIGRIWAVALTLVLAAYLSAQSDHSQSVRSWRNFYGVLHVREIVGINPDSGYRTLMNGTIMHGGQFRSIARRRTPTAYYGTTAAVGRAIRYLGEKGPVNVGVIGLGAGVMASYCRPVDKFRFYEINPMAAEIANSEFTFLSDCPTRPVVVLGDARLALEREPAHDFDLLVVDAFSSDSIPAHLLTKEAFRTYWKHMRSDGIIAVNTSNRYLDLTPIVAASAEDANKVALWIRDGGDKKNASVESDWVLVSATRLEDPLFRTPHSARIHPGRSIRTWTDDYSSLLGILK